MPVEKGMSDPIASDVYGDFSDFYDVYVGDWLEDVPFYLDYAKSLETPLLEIGAGSGRLTLPLARAGFPVVAVDISRSMLALLRERLSEEPEVVRGRVEIVEDDIRELDLGSRYALILVPFYTFNYLLTPQDQRTALNRLAAHLSAEGCLLIDVLLPLTLIDHCPSDRVLRVDTVDPRTGDRIRGWNTYSVDRERQIETRRHVFEVSGPDGTIQRREFTTRRRYSLPSELEGLFTRSGLSIVDVFTGYDREPAGGGSEQLLYLLGHS